MEKIKSKKISSSNNKNNKLSILIAQDGLCFCASNQRRINGFYTQDFPEIQRPENLLKAMESDETAQFLDDHQEKDTEVEVFYANSLFTLVPLPYFDPRKLSDYLKYNIKLLNTDEIAFDTLKEINAKLVYVPYVNINNYIFDRFGEFTYHHVVSPFISSSFRLQHVGSTTVCLEVYSHHFMMSVVNEGELLLCNAYEYYAPEDLVYYVLFAIAQLNLNRETLRLLLSGKIEENSSAYNLLYTYIKHIHFADHIKQGIELTETMVKEGAQHQYQLLLNNI